MALSMPSLSHLLSHAWAYKLLQTAAGSNRSHAAFVREYVKPESDDRILDVGCGPGDILGALPQDARYVGIDPSPEYIEAARVNWGNRGEFRCADGRDPIGSDSSFEIVLLMGVLHHLDDEGCVAVIRNAATALVPTGRLVAIEPAVVRGESRVAEWLIARDRGAFIREPAAYAELADEGFAQVSAEVRTDLLRVPYTHSVISCSGPMV
jgi:SAM-dependent methyltransferase